MPYRSSSIGTWPSGGDPNQGKVSAPTGWQVGDVALVALVTNDQSSPQVIHTNVSPAFTPYEFSPGVTHIRNDPGGLVITLWSRRLQSGDPSTYTFSLNVNVTGTAVAIAHEDPDPSVIFDVAVETVVSSATDPCPVPSLDTVNDGATHYSICGTDGVNNTFTSTPAGYLMAQNGGQKLVGVGVKEIPTAGATGVTNYSDGNAFVKTGLSIAVREGVAVEVLTPGAVEVLVEGPEPGVVAALPPEFVLAPLGIVFDLDCVDYTFLLNRRKVLRHYTNQSATAIILDIMSRYTAGFTTNHVALGLPEIEEMSFTRVDVTDALTRITNAFGGYWMVDYARDLHVFLSQVEYAGPITDADRRSMRFIRHSVDLSQSGTRAIFRGGGANTASAVAVGQTSLPIEGALTWYPETGGIVEVGPNQITYTGISGTSGAGSNTGYVAPPPGSFTLTAPVGAGSLDPSAVYKYALTYVTAEGETTVSTIKQVTSGAAGQAQVETMPVPSDPAITGKKLYRTEGGGSVLKFATALSLAQVVFTDTFSDASLGAVPPVINSAGVSDLHAPAGSTSLPVEDTAPFSDTGWADAGGNVFFYTGRTTTTGSGSLTGIPASGIGSIAAPVRSGTVTVVPHLTGIPASGEGSIEFPIAQGIPVNVVAVANDATAQAAMAASVGGDGIHELFDQDGRFSIVESSARAEAILAERKDPIETVTFDSNDQTLKVGHTVAIDVMDPVPIQGEFKIQRVTLSMIGFDGGRGDSRTVPTRSVEASSKRFSFEDVLRQIKGGVK